MHASCTHLVYWQIAAGMVAAKHLEAVFRVIWFVVGLQQVQ